MKTMHLKMSFGKWQSFYLSLNIMYGLKQTLHGGQMVWLGNKEETCHTCHSKNLGNLGWKSTIDTIFSQLEFTKVTVHKKTSYKSANDQSSLGQQKMTPGSNSNKVNSTT